MKNFRLILALSLAMLLLGLPAFAQPGFSLKQARESSILPVNRCGQVARHQWAQQNIPSYQADRQAIEAHTRNWIAAQNGQRSASVYTIPVVVHIIHRTSQQNISDAQIQSQMDVLNNDFRRLNADKVNTPSEYQSIAADVGFEFCLAKIDPSGNPSTGITRTQTSVTEIGDGNYYTTSQGGKTAWPTTKYLNIWVCEIVSIGDLLGFASPPGTAGPNDDGVVIDYRFFGTMGTVAAPLDKGRTVTHEVGHYFNLEHIWGLWGGCGDDDIVTDTPDQDAENYGCPAGATSCGSKDMYMNYMDYTDDGCMNLFTNGQKARMIAALTGPRQGLLTTGACNVAAGTSDRLNLSQQVRVYPNPVRSQAFVKINMPSRENVELNVYNLLGQNMIHRNHNLQSETLTLNVSDLASGVYIVEVKAGKERFTQKIVKQ